jgi:hypothetical protein
MKKSLWIIAPVLVLALIAVVTIVVLVLAIF